MIPTDLLLPDADIRYQPDFMRPADADALLAELLHAVTWRQDRIRLFGKEHPIPRLQAFQADAGIGYTYSGLRMNAAPWLPALLPLKQKLEALCDRPFNALLLNLYRDGQDAMGWHADNEPELGQNPLIASVSLGAPRRFRLRHSASRDTHALTLEHGSLLLMAGPTQHHWQHCLPRTKRCQHPRINLTFRLIHV
ncbi:MAG: alpha-ketoglutarate-dependent dioxygenase AlkB [Oceanospirillales bacterium]|uniref:DNA-N1-methyladenine dioxygenase n=1 Tax=Marinobacterium halophilum TaxID=267374 RepID=A0A2P8EYX2_9GAMM|nr:alpha-ketoglutarate-dependent dioxygenase AlkB [Marinobacterium halophilum]MBR9828886.1 alpha-ketoglutarate-dependent dioxygenase AlkB [Oceanospirillales bacterium]PSL14671.1 DNA-N1-methyladenine dioxygenase [Marinobacterium halophilum]